MSEKSQKEYSRTEEIRRKIYDLRVRSDLTLTEIAQKIGVAQGWLSKFMKGNEPTEMMVEKLERFVKNFRAAPRPPKEAKNIMRHLEILTAEDGSIIKDALDYFENEDISACAFIERDSIGILAEDKIRPKSPADPLIYKKIDYMDLSHGVVAVDVYTPYSEIKRLFGGASSLDAVIVMEKQQTKDREELLCAARGLITKDEVSWGAISSTGNPSRRFWKRNASTYVDQELPRKAAEIMSERILSTIEHGLPEALEVLDLGTGPGNFAVAFAQKATNLLPKTKLNILAIDQPIPEFEKLALKRFKEYPIIQANFGGLHQLKGMTEKFDVIGFNMVLPVRSTLTYPGLPEPEEYWNDAINVLKDDGKIAISYYDGKTLDEWFEEIEEVFAKFDRYFWRQIAQYYTLEQLEDELSEQGLRVIDSVARNMDMKSLMNGKAMLEYLTCSMPAVDFSFISHYDDKKRNALKEAVEKKLDKAVLEKKQFRINFVVTAKK